MNTSRLFALPTDTIWIVSTETGLIKSMRYLDYIDTRTDETMANTLAFTNPARATLESMRILDRIARLD